MPVLQNLENIMKILVLFVGGYYVIKHDFTIGELTAFIAYAGLLTLPITGLGWVTTIIQQGIVGLESIETIIKQETKDSDIKDLPEDQFKKLKSKGIKIKNFSFSYPDSDAPILKNINLEIKQGQTIGILGKIGSGKTTLVNCINRYLEIEPNRIFWGDHDLSKMAFGDVRKLIRTVSQDNFLFSDTVKENIGFGCDNEAGIKKDTLEKAIIDSALKDEIQRFPNNIDTIVGEKGIMLSGGQKQRISLARALIEPCELLILDNVLSAVDYETERFLLKTIHNNKNCKSLLIVSHRVQALEKADNILVLEDGLVIDQGTHLELINRPGHYQETHFLQNSKDEKTN